MEKTGQGLTIIRVTEATPIDIRALSGKLLNYLEDKNSRVYQENVAKFDIPEDYVREAFAEETLLKAADKGATFYLALDGDEIVGFAQIIPRCATTAELGRIVIFPQYEGKGIGTQLLRKILKDQEKKGTNNIIVNAGREETHARRFYENNGFKQTKDATIDTPWGKTLALVTYELHLGGKKSNIF